jgi:ribosomal silencing factor RsfS
MVPAARDYYALEEIWGTRPVRMKLATPTRRLAA